jgi:cyclophilin family peptidyl-prolyl cis-trans isomerase/HEAT repeat protein
MIRTLAILAAAALLGGCAAAVPPVSTPDPEAAGALLRLEDLRTYDDASVRAAAAHVHPEVRRRAALAAGRIGDVAALPHLAGLLADPDTAVAATAAFALGQLGDTAAVAHLVPYAAAGRIGAAPTVVGEAAYALGKLRGAVAADALQTLLRDAHALPASPARSHAAGLALLGAARFPRWDDFAFVTPWMDPADPALRYRAAYVLSRRPDARGTALLRGRERDAEPLVRQSAVRALTAPLADSAGIARDAALDVLIPAALNDDDLGVRVNALRALGTYESPRALAMLTDLVAVGAAHPYLEITAVESLARLGAYAASAAGPLHRIGLDERRPVALRTAALAALPRLDAAEAQSAAARLAGATDWRLRAAAARAYAAVGPATRPEITALAADDDGRVAAAAVEAFAAVADTVPAARAALREALGSADVVVRTNAIGGFARIADPATLPLLHDAYARALADTDNDAALAALSAVAAVHAVDPTAGPAFFARFRRSGDYLVRRRAVELFGDSIAARWLPVYPVDTSVTAGEYRAIAADVAPRRALIVTDAGEIELELHMADAPLTVRNFLSLAGAGYFDGQTWPRVVPNFVIQGGDPRGDTSGGPGYAIRDEMNRHLYGRGTLGMALSGPDTGGSQWFITHAPQPHLDGGYTVFGRVVRGMDVVDRVLAGDRIIRIVEVR